MIEIFFTAAALGSVNPAAIGIAVAVVGGAGLFIGLALGFAGKKFDVESDPHADMIRDELPGNNCGGCGYAGCDALAAAIASGEAKPNACTVASAETVGKIAAIMGTEAGEVTKRVAVVRCSGSCGKTKEAYRYFGPQDCRLAYLSPGHGAKKCSFGCCGFGSCAEVCAFDAIRIVDGLAVIDRDKCRGCGKCSEVCPNHLIELVPADSHFFVRCSSQRKGKAVKEACDDGCIGCSLCTRVCETGAITIQNNVAHIDQTLCTGCGKCAAKCPSHIIRML